MGTVNHGTQNVNYSFFDELRQEDWARKDNRITPRGVYHGGELTRISDSEIRMSALKIEIGDSNIQVSIDTQAMITITTGTLDSGSLSSAFPYIVLRYGYVYGPNNYFEVHAVATPETNDVVVGKVLWSVGVITGFDYTARTEPHTLDYLLKVSVISEVTLEVLLHGGKVNTGSGMVDVAYQRVGPFVPPTPPNNRIDLVYIDDVGSPQILQGSPAVFPTTPNYGGRLVLAEVAVNNGAVAFAESSVTDARAPYATGNNSPDNVSIILNGDGELAVAGSIAVHPYWFVKMVASHSQQDPAVFGTPTHPIIFDYDIPTVRGEITTQYSGGPGSHSWLYELHVNNTTAGTIIRQQRMPFVVYRVSVWVDGVQLFVWTVEGSKYWDLEMSPGPHLIQYVHNNQNHGAVNFSMWGRIIDGTDVVFVGS